VEADTLVLHCSSWFSSTLVQVLVLQLGAVIGNSLSLGAVAVVTAAAAALVSTIWLH